MLVQNSVYRNTYLTDGVNKDFYFSFPILESSQVLVQTSLLTNTDVVTTIDPSQYTVTGVGLTTGGHISFTTAPPTGSRIALTLNIPITQLYQYAELDSFPAKSHENALAKLTLICQQLKEQISRAVLISATSEGSTADIIASLYAARDSATASATAADLSAVSAEASATSAGVSATAAQQSADSAAANSAGLAAEVQNLSTMLIGAIFPLTCTDSYVPNGCVPANGSEYTRAQFPTLYDEYLVGGKLLTCTYTAQATQVGLTGNCAKFALDTTNQKFKVPLLKDGDSITQAASAAELGKSVKAGLPNITGNASRGDAAGDVGFLLASTSLGTSGALKRGSTLCPYVAAAGSSSGYSLAFDASGSNSIYRNDVTTVLDEQVRLRHFVVLASAQNNASVFDWSNYMAGLAGKANLNMDNLTQVGTTAIAHYSRLSGRYINVTAWVNGSTYTAPADGAIYWVNNISASAAWYNEAKNMTTDMAMRQNGINQTTVSRITLDVRKGDVVNFYGDNGNVVVSRFYYAEGAY